MRRVTPDRVVDKGPSCPQRPVAPPQVLQPLGVRGLESEEGAAMVLHDHEFWRVPSTVLSGAASVLGDEFSVTGVAITLGLPKDEVAHALSCMASVGWIGRIASCKSRNTLYGPWYEPRPKWASLAARGFRLFAREMETDLALADALQVARSRNRNWRTCDSLVTELWARPASGKRGPRRVKQLELAVACCARLGRPVRPTNSLNPRSAAWEQARAAFETSNSSLIAQDLPAVAAPTKLQLLYRVSSDFELWFAAPETVREFPTAFLGCVQEWRSQPEQFVDLRMFASGRDVERLSGIALETAAHAVGKF